MAFLASELGLRDIEEIEDGRKSWIPITSHKPREPRSRGLVLMLMNAVNRLNIADSEDLRLAVRREVDGEESMYKIVYIYKDREDETIFQIKARPHDHLDAVVDIPDKGGCWVIQVNSREEIMEAILKHLERMAEKANKR